MARHGCRGKARPGAAGPGVARRGGAGPGLARLSGQGAAGHGKAWLGMARRGVAVEARRDEASDGTAWLSGQGWARPGLARHGKAVGAVLWNAKKKAPPRREPERGLQVSGDDLTCQDRRRRAAGASRGYSQHYQALA